MRSQRNSICKACHRPMASISPEGELVPLGTQDQACDICRPFKHLYTNMESKLEAYFDFESRRYRAEQYFLAAKASTTAHKDFYNFLYRVEAPTQSGLAVSAHPAAPDFFLSNSLVPATNGTPAVGFDAAVVFYDREYRRRLSTLKRSDAAYFPGRNSPKDGGEFLNTSGKTIDADEYSGVRRRQIDWLRSEWVETEEGRETDEQWMADRGRGIVRVPTPYPWQGEDAGTSEDNKNSSSSSEESSPRKRKYDDSLDRL